ncbi:imidazolonepropionase-like amidohydrolase [Lutibacter sp. Hel_I_33_5]|uniref:amidohydrolase family protein n=1 Tax=Lutibacter sp. Hel_I_33_5 TaxID=1566289 RepID=UPI0011A3F459|nr:amidohydrolase family protein [Lutibacter sp. Hel_I_33_5]TVZ54894.1 imidazolonepropionase-like amidohydrolase [Lutibacter sp. Hel_I_33_5]
MRTQKKYLLLFILMVCSVGMAQTKTISFENVNVIPMDTDTIITNQRVIIANGKILKIEPASKTITIHIDVAIEASGKYLIPGLVETHYHLQNNIENEFKLLIANGITSARNMAEYDGQDHIKIRAVAQSNSILSPHYYTTGPYLNRSHFNHIDSVETIVKYHKERGYNYLKIADNLPKDIYLKLLETASKQDLEIVGHGQRELPLEYSLRIKSIAHVEEFMNIFSKEERTSISYLNKAAKEIKTSGVYVSPTLGIFEMISRYADKTKSEMLNNDENIKYLPKHYSDYWKSNTINYRKNSWFTKNESLIRLENELEWQKKFTLLLHKQGVPLMAGSDTYGLFLPGFSLHHELELIYSSGLSAYETLKTATVVPARYLNTISQSGTVTEGKLADLVLLEKNPLDDIRNTKTIIGVVIKGKWFNRKKLNKILLEVENSNK